MTSADDIRTPFVDDNLLEQRQQQREVLLSLPKALADQARAASGGLAPGGGATAEPSLAQRLLVERHARDRVDELLDQLQVDLVPVIDKGVAEAVDGYLSKVLGRRASAAATAWRDDIADDLAAQPEIDLESFGQLVDLLLMADDLADDGFSDLRFG